MTETGWLAGADVTRGQQLAHAVVPTLCTAGLTCAVPRSTNAVSDAVFGVLRKEDGVRAVSHRWGKVGSGVGGGRGSKLGLHL